MGQLGQNWDKNRICLFFEWDKKGIKWDKMPLKWDKMPLKWDKIRG